MAFKERLMDALHSAVARFNAGDTPSSSVAKTAADEGFNADQTSRLVETFNTARTIYHFKTASDRTEEVELAEPEVVMKLVFESEKKSEPADVFDTDTYLDYDRTEPDYSESMVLDKASAAPAFDFGEPAPTTNFAMDSLAQRAVTASRDHLQMAEDCESKAAMLEIMAEHRAEDLADGLRRLPEPVRVDRLSKLAAVAPESEAPALAILSLNFSDGYFKAAADDVVDDRDIAAEKRALAGVSECLAGRAELLAVADQLRKTAADITSQWLEAADLTPTPKPESCSDFLSPGLSVNAAAEGGKGGDGFTFLPQSPPVKPKPISDWKAVQNAGDSIMGTIMKTGPRKAEAENKDLSDRLKNVQRQMLLEDLLVNDPVLADEDPGLVARAYSQIQVLAPDLSRNREVVRAILRRASQEGTVGPYEAESFAKIEQMIRQIHGDPRSADDDKAKA